MAEPASPEDQNPRNPPTASQERLLQFSPAEIRLLIITIVGTVAGTLMALLIVGLAIWVVHVARPMSGVSPALFLILTLMDPVLLAFCWSVSYGRNRLHFKPGGFLDSQLKGFSKPVGLIGFWFFAIYFCFFSLVWVAAATGISK